MMPKEGRKEQGKWKCRVGEERRMNEKQEGGRDGQAAFILIGSVRK